MNHNYHFRVSCLLPAYECVKRVGTWLIAQGVPALLSAVVGLVLTKLIG
jgi:hypothetical protein